MVPISKGCMAIGGVDDCDVGFLGNYRVAAKDWCVFILMQIFVLIKIPKK